MSVDIIYQDLQDKLLTDIVITFIDVANHSKEIHCHRIVLMSHSKHFANLFKIDNKLSEISFHVYDVDIAIEVIKTFYLGNKQILSLKDWKIKIEKYILKNFLDCDTFSCYFGITETDVFRQFIQYLEHRQIGDSLKQYLIEMNIPLHYPRQNLPIKSKRQFIITRTQSNTIIKDIKNDLSTTYNDLHFSANKKYFTYKRNGCYMMVETNDLSKYTKLFYEDDENIIGISDDGTHLVIENSKSLFVKKISDNIIINIPIPFTMRRMYQHCVFSPDNALISLNNNCMRYRSMNWENPSNYATNTIIIPFNYCKYSGGNWIYSLNFNTLKLNGINSSIIYEYPVTRYSEIIFFSPNNKLFGIVYDNLICISEITTGIVIYSITTSLVNCVSGHFINDNQICVTNDSLWLIDLDTLKITCKLNYCNKKFEYFILDG